MSWVLKSGYTVNGQGDRRGGFERGNKPQTELRRQEGIILAERTMLIHIHINSHLLVWLDFNKIGIFSFS